MNEDIINKKAIKVLNNLRSEGLQTADIIEVIKKALSIHVVVGSYAIVRWHENNHDDVVCVDKQTALEYVQKYNKLAGEEMCFLDEDIWLPLKTA